MGIVTKAALLGNSILAKEDTKTMTENLAELEELQKIAEPGVLRDRKSVV